MLWVAFFPDNCDKTDEVGAEISDSFKFGILTLLAWVKSGTFLKKSGVFV